MNKIGYFKKDHVDYTLEFDGHKTFHIIDNHTGNSITVKDPFYLENIIFDIGYTLRYNHSLECNHKGNKEGN